MKPSLCVVKAVSWPRAVITNVGLPFFRALSAFTHGVTSRQDWASHCLSLKEPQRQVNTSAFIKSTAPFSPLKHKEHIHISLSFLSSTKSTGSELMSKVFVWRFILYWHLYSAFHRLHVKTLYRAINHTPFLMKLYVGNWAPILPSAMSHMRDTGSVMKPAQVGLKKMDGGQTFPP